MFSTESLGQAIWTSGNTALAESGRQGKPGSQGTLFPPASGPVVWLLLDLELIPFHGGITTTTTSNKMSTKEMNSFMGQPPLRVNLLNLPKVLTNMWQGFCE